MFYFLVIFIFQVDPHAYSTYDAVYLYAIAVNACLADGWPAENSTQVWKYLKDRVFKG